MKFINVISNLGEWYESISGGFEKGALLKIVTSNLLVGREKIEPVYRKPFDKIAKRKTGSFWRPHGDLNPGYRRERPAS